MNAATCVISSGPMPWVVVAGVPMRTPLPTETQRWLAEGVSAEVVGARAVALGPEPMIGAQRIVLSLEDRRLTLATDGLGAFVVDAP